MRSKWIIFILGLCTMYAFMSYKQKPDILPTHEEKPSFIADVTSFIKELTADPQANSLTSHDQPLLNEEIIQVVPLNNDLPVGKTENINLSKSKEAYGFIEKKISNAIYNILHTAKGQEILENILLNPRQDKDPAKKEQEPNPYNNNSIMNILDGEGEEAECGDIVTINYISRLVNGQEIENTNISKNPLTLQIGNGEVIKGIEYAVIGMKQGGMRRLVVPPSLAYKEQKFSKGLVGAKEFITLDIELINLKPALKNWQSKIRIFQDNEKNTGHPLLCGDEVYFNYKISTSNEKLLASNSKRLASFTLGSKAVPAAINKAFTGIKIKSQRSMLIPSSLLFGKKIGFLENQVNIPANEMLIFEIDTNLK